IFTPLLVRLLMQASGQVSSFGPLLLKITLLTLMPFAVGMGLGPLVREWVDGHRSWLNILSNGVILLNQREEIFCYGRARLRPRPGRLPPTKGQGGAPPAGLGGGPPLPYRQALPEPLDEAAVLSYCEAYHMQIKIGYDIALRLPAPTAVIYVLHVHPSRAGDL